MKHWTSFKNVSENKFKSLTIQQCWGFQIQKNTKWNVGLSTDEINKMETEFGFEFPNDYVHMLESINGFNTPHISIDPEGNEPDEFERRCYQYPNDLNKTQWLIDEVNQYKNFAIVCLNESSFNTSSIEGFVPLYGHRALVVLQDKTKSPVLSIWGNDIIVFGKSLLDYWCNELELNIQCIKP